MKFIKENLVLVVGLTLPVLLMLGFMLSTMIPQTIGDPPQYSLVFSTNEGYSNGPSQFSVNYVVKDGVLKAQFTRNPPNSYYYGLKKLYLYDAATQKVRDLNVSLPSDADSITTMREDAVEATKGMKLDTTLQAPDGYELSYEGYSRSGLFGDVFWGGGYSSETRLRKGGSSVRLIGTNNQPFYYGNIQFIAWVMK